ncbi:MAG TPA: PilZ domain-containing protein [Kofleriaceae bacterium]|nr:PilZ domain-containing protein [Kofleriaceae bacterium]
MPHDSRRKSIRIRVSFQGAILVGRREVSGRVLNINLSGFFIAIDKAVPEGELVKLELAIPDGEPPMACFGWLRASDLAGAGGAGVKLFAQTREQHDRWVSYYQRVRRELLIPPPPPKSQRVVVVEGSGEHRA